MSKNVTRFDTGIQIKPSTGVVLDTNGEMKYDSSVSGLVAYSSGASGEVVLSPSPHAVIINNTLSVTGAIASSSSISTTASVSAGAVSATSISAGNLSLTANSLISTNSNGNITIDPNGTGYIGAESEFNILEISTPANPAAGRLKLYAKSDDLLYIKNSGGTETQLAAAVTSLPKLEALYRFVVGTTAQVAAGSASYSSLTAAISAASAGDRITLLAVTVSENVTVNKPLNIEGFGYGSVVSGSVTFTSAANFSSINAMKLTQDITLNSGTEGIMGQIFLASGKTIVDNSAVTTNNYLIAMQET